MQEEAYREAFHRRARAEHEAVLAARREARQAAERAVAALSARFAPRRTLLIGSLARGTFLPGSDIDLAVEGLDPAAVAEAERAATEAAGLPVDILRMEPMDPAWRMHHQRFGEALDGCP